MFLIISFRFLDETGSLLYPEGNIAFEVGQICEIQIDMGVCCIEFRE
ncbi:hypothetical protein SAMN05444380_11668 [Thermophagus xiamenensis]|uniref:Uncharacterized protein n=1 Tax=Thermophagus xiamenensis TaxID=385682 RepID=A0A1I2CMK1_9BACT|nr:hypothetical protein SAMN05444380_11668 [Thermophagus xiamenensis]